MYTLLGDEKLYLHIITVGLSITLTHSSFGHYKQVSLTVQWIVQVVHQTDCVNPNLGLQFTQNSYLY
jgi:hypothetical protein